MRTIKSGIPYPKKASLETKYNCVMRVIYIDNTNLDKVKKKKEKRQVFSMHLFWTELSQ